MLLIDSIPQGIHYVSAERCEVPATVDFDGEEFVFVGYSVYEDNRGNAEWSYYYGSPTRAAVRGAFSWSVTA
jgi:hypothetical protein